MRLLVILLFLCATARAHEIETRYQYWWLRGPDVKSWRQDVTGSLHVQGPHSVLVRATHFERFREEDQQIMLGWRHKNSQGYWDLTHADGGGNKVLAIRDTQLTHGRPFGHGFDGWINLKAQGYHTNDLHMATVGVDKEWRGGTYLLTSVGAGHATYQAPADTQAVWGASAQLGRYQEDRWKTWLLLAQGEEAQALVALAQTRALRFVTYGAGVEKNLTPALRTGLAVERSYYPAVNTRLESLTAHLAWNWGAP
jgi:hypothetical protein